MAVKTPAHKVAFTRLLTPNGDWLVDQQLRPMLVRDAKSQGLSVTKMAIKILAEKYGQAFEGTQHESKASEAGDVLNLRLPVKLYDAIDRRTQRPATVPDAVRAALSAHYGLRVPAKPRRARRV